MVRTYKKGEGIRFNEFYTSTDFDCRCNDCINTIIDSDLVDKLDLMCRELGQRLKITSGYRCAAYQADLKRRGYDTAKGVSQHELGKAADVSDGKNPGSTLEGAASRAGFKSVGVGKMFVHVDLRDGANRRWTYTY